MKKLFVSMRIVMMRMIMFVLNVGVIETTMAARIPPYMKSSVSQQFLTKNPIYKEIFRRCPNCNQFSLKPLGMNKIKNISEILKSEDRKCTLCGYIHVKDLVVSTTKASNSENNNNIAVKEGRILEEDDSKKK